MASATAGGVRQRFRESLEGGGPGSGGRDARRWYRVDLSTTPGRLRLLIAVLVLLSLAWGGLAAFTASRYASAAARVVGTREPLSRDALQIYQHLSDANDQAATAFLIGGLEPPITRQHYLGDISAATSEIDDAISRIGTSGGTAASDLRTLSADLTVYTGEVDMARAYNRQAMPLGAAYLREASKLMHQMLLTANDMYTVENGSLAAGSARATGLPLIAVTLAVGLAVGCALFLSSRWLRRRTNRVLNLGVIAALVAVATSMIWLATAYAESRSDLLTAQALGSAPVQALAKVSLAAQQGHSDESLTLIDNTGYDQYQQDFLTQQRLLGPGQGTLLTAVVAQGGPGARLAAGIPLDAQLWFAAHAAARKLDDAGQHAAAVRSVLGTTGVGNAGFQYEQLAGGVSAAMDLDQKAFDTHAAASTRAFTLLVPGVILAALVMAVGCAWGLNRRLAEYR
jgi:hypothetical protein